LIDRWSAAIGRAENDQVCCREMSDPRQTIVIGSLARPPRPINSPVAWRTDSAHF
jgi:hypothetical protein